MPTGETHEDTEGASRWSGSGTHYVCVDGGGQAGAGLPKGLTGQRPTKGLREGSLGVGGRGHSRGQGPGVRAHLALLRNKRGASVTRTGGVGVGGLEKEPDTRTQTPGTDRGPAL